LDQQEQQESSSEGREATEESGVKACDYAEQQLGHDHLPEFPLPL
jgi:hypothetical protein